MLLISCFMHRHRSNIAVGRDRAWHTAVVTEQSISFAALKSLAVHHFHHSCSVADERDQVVPNGSGARQQRPPPLKTTMTSIDGFCICALRRYVVHRAG